MAEQHDDALTEAAKRAIHRYLTRLAVAGVAFFGVVNVVSLLTVVPNLAASRVTESEPLKNARDQALVASGGLQENLKRAQQGLGEVERSLREINEKIEAFKKTDTATLVSRAAAMNSLGDDTKKILDAVAALRSEIPTRVLIKEGADGFWQSDPFSNQAERDCPGGFVQVGNHFGIANRDLRIRCRQITLSR
jgi:hypothetical protein